MSAKSKKSNRQSKQKPSLLSWSVFEKTSYSITLILLLILVSHMLVDSFRTGFHSLVLYLPGIVACLFAMFMIAKAFPGKPQTRGRLWFVGMITFAGLVAAIILAIGLLQDLFGVYCGFAGAQTSCLSSALLMAYIYVGNPISFTIIFAIALGPWLVELVTCRVKKR